jgi:hypothetical protein
MIDPLLHLGGAGRGLPELKANGARSSILRV